MEAFLYLILPLIILLVLGVPVAFAFLMVLLVNSIIYFGFSIGPYLSIVSIFDSLALFSLLPVPLFMFMGIALFETGLAARGIDALSKLFGEIHGRLSYLSCLTGALLGMLSGATVASIAVMGTTILPEMLERGYSREISFGPILASSSLAMIIPPSSLTVIYATIAEISVGKLLIAGLIPGILMTLAYMALIFIKLKRNPSLAPKYHISGLSFKEKFRIAITDLLPLCLLIFLVTGIFVIGIATPTEAAALGSVGTVVLAAVYKCFNRKVILNSMKGTLKITCMSLLIIGSTVVYSYLLAYTGLIADTVNLVIALNLPPIGVLLLMIVLVVILGCFIESVPIMMITIPIFTPIAQAVGFNGIWLGIIVLIAIQMGLTTPPFGMLHFVMKGVAPKGTKMIELYSSALPYLLCNVAIVALIIVFPFIVLWLPGVL